HPAASASELKPPAGRPASPETYPRPESWSSQAPRTTTQPALATTPQRWTSPSWNAWTCGSWNGGPREEALTQHLERGQGSEDAHALSIAHEGEAFAVGGVALGCERTVDSA